MTRTAAYKTKAQRATENALSGLPEIDLDKAEDLLARQEFLPVPDGWPRNWQWVVAMRHAAQKIEDELRSIEQSERRITALRHSISSFREFLDRGDLWPGLKEVTVACLKGGFKTVIVRRDDEDKEDTKAVLGDSSRQAAIPEAEKFVA